MPKPPYPNAPIVEAVIDFRVDKASDVSLDNLRRVQEPVKNEYPKIQGRFNVESSVQFDERDVDAHTKRTQIGHVFSSHSEEQVFHSRVDGFSFSRMRPYESWAPFQTEALKLWRVYEEFTSPGVVTRVGVRYINRIEIPAAYTIDLKDYFKTGPEIAPDLPQAIDQFFFALQMPLPQYDCRLNLASTIVDPENDTAIAVVLDIDVWRTTELMMDGPVASSLEEITSQLRTAKNAVFEASITDRTRRLFG